MSQFLDSTYFNQLAADRAARASTAEARAIATDLTRAAVHIERLQTALATLSEAARRHLASAQAVGLPVPADAGAREVQDAHASARDEVRAAVKASDAILFQPEVAVAAEPRRPRLLPPQPNPDERVYVAVRHMNGNSETVTLQCARNEHEARLIASGVSVDPAPPLLYPNGLYSGRPMNFGYSGGGPNAMETAILHDFFKVDGVAAEAIEAIMTRTFARLLSIGDKPMAELSGHSLLVHVHDLKKAITRELEGEAGQGRLTRTVWEVATSPHIGGERNPSGAALASALIQASYLPPAEAVRRAFEARIGARRAADGAENRGQQVDRLTRERFAKQFQPAGADTTTGAWDGKFHPARKVTAAEVEQHGTNGTLWRAVRYLDQSIVLKFGPPSSLNDPSVLGYVFAARPLEDTPSARSAAIMLYAGSPVIFPDDDHSEEAEICRIIETLQRMAVEPERAYSEACELRDNANSFIRTFTFQRADENMFGANLNTAPLPAAPQRGSTARR